MHQIGHIPEKKMRLLNSVIRRVGFPDLNISFRAFPMPDTTLSEVPSAGFEEDLTRMELISVC